jgi:hypothetical protein
VRAGGILNNRDVRDSNVDTLSRLSLAGSHDYIQFLSVISKAGMKLYQTFAVAEWSDISE